MNSAHRIWGGGRISIGESCLSSFWSRVILPAGLRTLQSRVEEEVKVTGGYISPGSSLNVEVMMMTIGLCVRFGV